MSGIGLARDFYHQIVRPLLGDTDHSAALLGAGSEVLGFDDEISTDHDFGPRLQIFLPAGTDPAPTLAALTALPEEFGGHRVYFPAGVAAPAHRVHVTTSEDYFTSWLTTDPATAMTLADWVLTPTQTLACLTNGAVFHDPHHALATRRTALAWYPDDIWRYALAAGWLRIGQDQALLGRAGARGDDLGAAILAARLAKDLMRQAFLLERRWAPYGKWFGHAYGHLPLAVPMRRGLDTLLTAATWQERETGFCAAASIIGRATNRLGLADPVDPHPRRFHDRDIRTVDAEGFTTALTTAITHDEVRALLERLGTREHIPVPSLPGTIDQAVDTADVLRHPGRCRAMAPALLGLSPSPRPGAA
jgi:hypothetical protein